MIHPSYSELTEAINASSEENDNTIMLNSRYSLVLATSKRARQIIAGAEPLVSGAAGKKPLSIAIDEFYRGKVKIIADDMEEEEKEEEQAVPQGAAAETDSAVEEVPEDDGAQAEDSAEA